MHLLSIQPRLHSTFFASKNVWSKPYNFNELLLKIQFNWSLFVKLRESLLISCLEPFWQNGRMWDGISIPLNFQMMWTRWKPTKLDIDWYRYSYLSSFKFYIKHYRIRTEANDWLRYILRTLQEIIHHNITANKGAQQQLYVGSLPDLEWEFCFGYRLEFGTLCCSLAAIIMHPLCPDW